MREYDAEKTTPPTTPPPVAVRPVAGKTCLPSPQSGIRASSSQRSMLNAHVYFKRRYVPRHSMRTLSLPTFSRCAARLVWRERLGGLRSCRRVVVIPSNVPHRSVALEARSNARHFNPPPQDLLAVLTLTEKGNEAAPEFSAAIKQFCCLSG